MVLVSISRISVGKHMYNMLHWETDLNVILISVLKKKNLFFTLSIQYDCSGMLLLCEKCTYGIYFKILKKKNLQRIKANRQ